MHYAYSKGSKYKDMLGDELGHVQKRVGSRLRKLKSSNKGVKL